MWILFTFFLCSVLSSFHQIWKLVIIINYVLINSIGNLSHSNALLDNFELEFMTFYLSPLKIMFLQRSQHPRQCRNSWKFLRWSEPIEIVQNFASSYEHDGRGVRRRRSWTTSNRPAADGRAERNLWTSSWRSRLHEANELEIASG